MATVAPLLVRDIYPHLFPGHAHDLLGALPLTLIAIAYLTYQGVRSPNRLELAKALLLAAAFLFWAANQLLSDLPQATLFNDIAIGLFVLDVFLVIVGGPVGSSTGAFAETSKPGQSSSRSQ